MMLPEHKEQIVVHRQEVVKRTQPQLDAQAIEEMNMDLQHAIHEKREVVMTLFHEDENRSVIARPLKVNQHNRVNQP
ncbi:YolD-like family protein [Paenibacillus cymbidii]|uniref:YolD-like family protein n=1 Tax=Paenibacillus cymbidii TaxID=1639034 RepID=UPI001A9BE975|nr:YolD-like family protein [Paenibacillus cymbidii]